MKTVIEVDLWQLYWADSLQYFADCWPPNIFLSRLFSEGTTKVEVLPATKDGRGILVLRVYGECFDGPASFDYELKRTDFDKDDKQRILELIKVCYPPTRESNRATPKRVARALGIVFR